MTFFMGHIMSRNKEYGPLAHNRASITYSFVLHDFPWREQAIDKANQNVQRKRFRALATDRYI